MAEELDREKIRKLLEEADNKWFTNKARGFDYQGHLDFVAYYLVKNYNNKRDKRKK